MPNTLQLHDLYTEALVRHLIEKTKSCGVLWEHVSGTQFKANVVDTDTWDYLITKTTIGNATAKYTLDVKKNNVTHVSVAVGPLPHTGRDSVTKDLYEIVEIIVLQLDIKLRDAIQFVQNLPDCRTE